MSTYDPHAAPKVTQLLMSLCGKMLVGIVRIAVMPRNTISGCQHVENVGKSQR